MKISCATAIVVMAVLCAASRGRCRRPCSGLANDLGRSIREDD